MNLIELVRFSDTLGRRLLSSLPVWIFPLLFAAAFASQARALEAANPAQALTEAESVRLALARPGVSGLAAGKLALAASEVRHAGLWSNPEFEYSRETVGRAAFDNVEDSYWLSQSFQISGARGLAKEAAGERLTAAQFGVRADQLRIESDTRVLFYQLLHKQNLIAALEHWASRMSGIEAVVRKRQDAGEVSGYDLLRLSRELAATDAALHRELAVKSRLWAQMSVLLGGFETAGRFAGVAGELLPGEPSSLAELHATLADRPDIARLEREVAALDLERRASARAWVPELTLGIGHKSVDDDLGNDTGPMVAAGLTLPLFDRGQAAEQRVAAEAEIARNHHQLLLREAEGEVSGLWQELASLRSAALKAQRSAQEEAGLIVKIAETAYTGGELGVLELLDAYRSAYLANVQALELSATARRAYIELDLLTGGAVK